MLCRRLLQQACNQVKILSAVTTNPQLHPAVTPPSTCDTNTSHVSFMSPPQLHISSWKLACLQPARFLHTTRPCQGLMEFFEDESNWGKENIKTGRPWLLPELRLKSNEDLHKLWYILLKERNMLLTMEVEYARAAELFPNPERLFKVDESMQNILEIVAERDDAYSRLETGESSRPQYRMVSNFLGLQYRRKLKEHSVPHWMNRKYRLLHTPQTRGMAKYFSLYMEKQRNLANRRVKWRNMKLQRLRKKFPHLQLEEGEGGRETERLRG
ncbi:39S ribosomal protein L47, mitochondrial-like [Argonauta hians]